MLNFNLNEEQLNILEELLTVASIRGANIAIKQQKETEKSRVDKRLHNTYLLLKNYNLFKDSLKNINTESNVVTFDELLKDCNNEEDNNFLQSILKTKKRTKAMIDYVDSRLELYKIKCQMSNREDIERRYRVINYLYLKQKEDGTNHTVEETAERFAMSTGGICKTKNIALKEIAILLFGIDAMKLE